MKLCPGPELGPLGDVFPIPASDRILVGVPSSDSQYSLRDEADILNGLKVEIIEDLLQQIRVAENAVHWWVDVHDLWKYQLNQLRYILTVKTFWCINILNNQQCFRPLILYFRPCPSGDRLTSCSKELSDNTPSPGSTGDQTGAGADQDRSDTARGRML